MSKQFAILKYSLRNSVCSSFNMFITASFIGFSILMANLDSYSSGGPIIMLINLSILLVLDTKNKCKIIPGIKANSHDMLLTFISFSLFVSLLWWGLNYINITINPDSTTSFVKFTGYLSFFLYLTIVQILTFHSSNSLKDFEITAFIAILFLGLLVFILHIFNIAVIPMLVIAVISYITTSKTPNYDLT